MVSYKNKNISAEQPHISQVRRWTRTGALTHCFYHSCRLFRNLSECIPNCVPLDVVWIPRVLNFGCIQAHHLAECCHLTFCVIQQAVSIHHNGPVPPPSYLGTFAKLFVFGVFVRVGLEVRLVVSAIKVEYHSLPLICRYKGKIGIEDLIANVGSVKNKRNASTVARNIPVHHTMKTP